MPQLSDTAFSPDEQLILQDFLVDLRCEAASRHSLPEIPLKSIGLLASGAKPPTTVGGLREQIVEKVGQHAQLLTAAVEAELLDPALLMKVVVTHGGEVFLHELLGNDDGRKMLDTAVGARRGDAGLDPVPTSASAADYPMTLGPVL